MTADGLPDDPEPVPYTISVSDEALWDLRRRLEATRWPDQLDGVGWTYGTERDELQDLCRYWADDYDWRREEAALNAIPQYTTTVGGENVHYLHVRSPHDGAVPLVVTHGWPGSVVELLDVVGPLVDPPAHGGDAADAFHLVAPSIPGYTFSGPTVTTGFDVKRLGTTVVDLMARLGYGRYLAQGGDWGAIATSWVGSLDPEHCMGIHLNMYLWDRSQGLPDDLTDDERARLADMAHFAEAETGYQQIQGTKPQTLAYGLNDSPAGLAAWILEKFRTWSDCDGDLWSVHDRDRLLTNISAYWFTGTIGSSVRMYRETRASGASRALDPVRVPTGIADFPRELYRPGRRLAETLYDVTHFTSFERGGHFAAMERPLDLVDDIRAFARTVR